MRRMQRSDLSQSRLSRYSDVTPLRQRPNTFTQNKSCKRNTFLCYRQEEDKGHVIASLVALFHPVSLSLSFFFKQKIAYWLEKNCQPLYFMLRVYLYTSENIVCFKQDKILFDEFHGGKKN